MPPSHPTLASLLKKRATARHWSANGISDILPDFGPLKSGYDHFFGISAVVLTILIMVRTLPGVPLCLPAWRTNSRGRGPSRASRVHDEPAWRSGGADHRELCQVERAVPAQPPFPAPHWPWRGPTTRPSRSESRSSGFAHRDGGTRRTYATMVQSLDANVGRVLQALDVTGLASNTIVVFTSDNGGERFSDTWPFSRHEGRVARRRPSHPGGSAVARPYRGRICRRSSYHHDGLDADSPSCRRHCAGLRLSIGRPGPGTDRHWSRHRIRGSAFGATRPDRNAPLAVATGNTFASPETNFCSTLFMTRASAPISKIGKKTCSHRLKASRSLEMAPCCRKGRDQHFISIRAILWLTTTVS